MALPLRPRRIPQCTACLRNYAFGSFHDAAAPATTALQQQIRGKKKLSNNSSSVTVKLLKDTRAYGRKGTIVPVSRGQMRNVWFPTGIAEYVTLPELKVLRANNTPIERDFDFGIQQRSTKGGDRESMPSEDDPALRGASMFQKGASREIGTVPPRRKAEEIILDKLSPERSAELVEIFVPQRLEFYRQPIVEEVKEPQLAVQESEKKRPSFMGAAGDLLAARTPRTPDAKSTPQAIYGSVSTQDVLNAVRAVMANNDEAARVVLQENDLHFVELPELEGAETGKLKHIGEFLVEIKIRGSDKAARRTIRIMPEEHL